VNDRVAAISGLHPLLAGLAFSHLMNGDDVSIANGNVTIEFGSQRHNVDGPAVTLAHVDPDAILYAQFNGEPVDETVLAALVRKTLDLAHLAGPAPPPTSEPSTDSGSRPPGSSRGDRSEAGW
jgi:hypothetical protein